MLTALVLAALAEDPVVSSFAFFGCNRVDQKQWDAKTNPSSANLAQLRQTFADISALRPRPKLLLATGDLVLGYADDDGTTVRNQLEAWTAEFKRSPLFGKVELVPVSGNHELNRKTKAGKVSSPITAAIWKDWVARSGFSVAGRQDESGLNFRFDRDGVRFLVLNTDTIGPKGEIGGIDLAWAEREVRDANRDRLPTFVVGHRNLWDPFGSSGDSPIRSAESSEFLQTLARSRSVVGYLCAHVHAWDVNRLGGDGPWQIIAGNGGSDLEPDWKPKQGTTFGFAVIQKRRSGQLELLEYGRPTAGPAVPATLRSRTVLRTGK